MSQKSANCWKSVCLTALIFYVCFYATTLCRLLCAIFSVHILQCRCQLWDSMTRASLYSARFWLFNYNSACTTPKNTNWPRLWPPNQNPVRPLYFNRLLLAKHDFLEALNFRWFMFLVSISHGHSQRVLGVKPGFHYLSWRSELTGDRFPLPVNTFPLAELTGRVDGPSTRLVETWRIMETGHPSTRAVNSGSGNQALSCGTSKCWLRQCRFCLFAVILPWFFYRVVFVDTCVGYARVLVMHAGVAASLCSVTSVSQPAEFPARRQWQWRRGRWTGFEGNERPPRTKGSTARDWGRVSTTNVDWYQRGTTYVIISSSRLLHGKCRIADAFSKSAPNLHLASSEQWCWSGGRAILTELSLFYSIV